MDVARSHDATSGDRRQKKYIYICIYIYIRAASVVKKNIIHFCFSCTVRTRRDHTFITFSARSARFTTFPDGVLLSPYKKSHFPPRNAPRSFLSGRPSIIMKPQPLHVLWHVFILVCAVRRRESKNSANVLHSPE